MERHTNDATPSGPVALSPTSHDRSSAQVAPLPASLSLSAATGIPRQDDFHVGKVLGDASQVLKPPREEEESYIPVALARAHLTKVVEDMHAMKEEQTAKMALIMDKYKAIEAETKSYYEGYIGDLKRKAKDKFRAEQAKYSALQEESKAQQELASEMMRELQEAGEYKQQQHEAERGRWREDLELCLLRQEEELTTFHKAMQKHLRSALHDQAHSMRESHRSQVDLLRMCWEDARGESLRMLERARVTQRGIRDRESQYEEEVDRLRREFAVEMETFKCVSTVVNRVVDMEEQTRRRRRSRELRNEIQRLSKQIRESMGRERELEGQLQHVTTQYEEMEQRAVKQTMEVFLRTVELTPPDDRADSKSSKVVKEGEEEEEEEKESKEEKREEGGREHKRIQREESVKVVDKPETREDEAQTSAWKEMADSHVQVAVEMCDAAVETEESETQAESMRGETPDDTQRKTEEEVKAADRVDEHRAELSRLKSEYRSAKVAIQQCVDSKTDAKTRIKQWLADFQKEHAREPTIEEKTQVKDLYLAFKQSEEAYNAAKDVAAKAKALYHARLMEVEALSLTSTLDSARESDGPSSRPGTAASVDASGSRPVSREAAEALANVAALEKEIEGLRGELIKAQEAQRRADAAANEAVAEAKRVVAEAKQSADRLAEAAEHKYKAGETESAVVGKEMEHARAESKGSTRQEQEEEERRTLERKMQEAEALRYHQQMMELFAREAKALEQTQSELQAAITALRDEITQRTAEKEALEAQVERLRLHIELMEEGGGLADDDSDAKSTSRRNRLASEGEAADQEELEEAVNEDEGDEEEKLADDEDEEADAKAPIGALSPLNSPMPLSEAEKVDAAREDQLVASIRESIEAGKAQWNRGDKAKCFQIYVKMCEKSVELLKEMKAPPIGRREEVVAFKGALQEAGRLPPAKGSMVLRRQLDACLAACEARTKERDGKETAAAMAALAAAQSPVKAASTPSPQRQAQQQKKSNAPKSSTDAAADDRAGIGMAATTPVGGTRVLEDYKQKLKALEAKAKADRVRITQLEASLNKAESQVLNASVSGAGNGGGANTVILERKLADAEKKHAKALEDAEKMMKRDMAAISQQLSASQAKSQSLQEQVEKLTKELTVVGGRATQLSKMEEEVSALRVKAAQVDTLSQELTTRQGELVKLEASYKDEQALRKKYYNQIEDMKGKIRVYARCRPMSSSETERGCDTCVRFMDEYSLELKTSHGPKTFAYDQVFTPASTQDQVFEDTKNLLQSAVDGYNVCIFAYGQTGSGKTFTMTGSESLPGLSPRAIHHLFRLAEESSGNHSITFQAFMLELYNDALIDLFYLVDGGAADHGPKLEIKKNDRGMVFVSNITQKSCSSAQQTLKLFEAANKKRQVGATKMNAESSRSHSVFSLVIENYNKTTKTTSIGKLSLVDLAGSERAGKTGATNDRLKEAQAINKSLSALGDVIAALSSGEKFIPYRNNKLTQLMQDSLGGNAKTLMFVNISPADYNQEETQTSLQYASRVKLITNNANKTSESETVNRLKAIIKQLRAGKADIDVDGLDI